MSQNKYKQSKLQRSQNRKILFQNNRIYLSQHREWQDKDEFGPQLPQNNLQDESTFTDPNYSTIIKTFTKRIYKYSELPFLIRKLRRDVYSQYQAVIGIYSLGNSLLTANNELQVMGTGIVAQLVKIMINKQHPFLQVRAVSVMIRLITQMSRDRIGAFFNISVIPYHSIMVILSSQVDCLAQITLIFLARLIRANYRIETTDNRIDFLQVLEKLVLKWSSSSQKMNKVFALINQLEIYYWTGRYLFNEKLCYILNTIMNSQISRQVNKSHLIFSILWWTSERRNLRRIAYLLQQKFEQAQQKHPQLCSLIDGLLNFPLNSKCILPRYWLTFIQSYVGNKNGFKLLQQLKIKEKLFESIHQYHDQHDIIQVLIQVFQLLLSNYLKQQKLQVVSQLMHQQSIFLQIVNIFKTSSAKKKHKILYSTVNTIIKAYKIFNNLQILVKFELIDLFVKSSVRWDCMSMKSAFKNLKLVLQQLKNHAPADSPRSMFIEIAKLVVSDANYEIIMKGLQANYLKDLNDLKIYYQSLKNTVNQAKLKQQRKGQDIFIQQKDKIQNQDVAIGWYLDLNSEKT